METCIRHFPSLPPSLHRPTSLNSNCVMHDGKTSPPLPCLPPSLYQSVCVSVSPPLSTSPSDPSHWPSSLTQSLSLVSPSAARPHPTPVRRQPGASALPPEWQSAHADVMQRAMWCGERYGTEVWDWREREWLTYFEVLECCRDGVALGLLLGAHRARHTHLQRKTRHLHTHTHTHTHTYGNTPMSMCWRPIHSSTHAPWYLYCD